MVLEINFSDQNIIKGHLNQVIWDFGFTNDNRNRIVVGSLGGLATYQMPGSTVVGATIGQTLSYSYGVGRVIREAIAQKKNVLNELLKYLDTLAVWHCEFLDGKVIQKKDPSNTNGSLDLGTVQIQNEQGDILEIVYENENLYATLNDETWAMAPDLISYLTPNGPVSNVEIAVGMEVTIVGMPANNKLRSKTMIKRFEEVLSELDIHKSYISIEKLHPSKL